MQARFVSGDPIMVPHTPEVDVAAGEVVIVGSLALVAHLPIKAGVLGSLAAGGGLYEVACLDPAGIQAGKKVGWDNTQNAVTGDLTATDNLFGASVEDVAGDGQLFLIRHLPDLEIA